MRHLDRHPVTHAAASPVEFLATERVRQVDPPFLGSGPKGCFNDGLGASRGCSHQRRQQAEDQHRSHTYGDPSTGMLLADRRRKARGQSSPMRRALPTASIFECASSFW